MIEIKNLNKKYNNILAVKNIDFKINKGSIIGLLGPNGCGKTTTIGMMLGLINPKIIPIVVVFPHPFGPKRPTIEPFSIVKFISLTAKILLYFLFKFFISIVIYSMLSSIYHLSHNQFFYWEF